MPSQLLSSDTYRKTLGTLSPDDAFAGGEVVALGAWPTAARIGILALKGTEADDQILTGGEVWARNPNVLGGTPFLLGALPETVIVSATKGVVLPLDDVGAIARDVMVSGTLSAGSVVLELHPLEVQ